MSERKSGCSVELELRCTDGEGRLISDIPKGGWYGFDRQTANMFAMALHAACMGVIEQINKAQYGEGWKTVSPISPPTKK